MIAKPKPSIENDPFSDVEDHREKSLDFVSVRPSNKFFKYRFDFEIGYLIKSPCKECRGDMNLPGCADGCAVLDKIQSILAEGVSCTRRF